MIVVVHDLASSAGIQEALSLIQHEGEILVIKKADRPFGEVLRAARVSRGLTLAQVGHATGLSVTYLSDVERGNRGVTLANAVGLREVLDAPRLTDVLVGEKIWRLATS